MTRVFDCFPFFNELELLNIRFRELSDVVDYFVLVEASRTHTGVTKPYYFQENKHLFTKYEHKIIHKMIDIWDDPGVTPWQNWGREIIQRNTINSTLADLSLNDDDIVLSADVDEIPRRQAVEAYVGRGDICCLEEKTYHYNLNCLLETPTIDPKICRYNSIKEIGVADLRYFHHKNPHHIIKNAGWHFSFMGGTEKIIEKMRAYAHYDPRDPKMETYLSKDNVESSAREFKSVFLRDDVKYAKTKDFSDMPRYITENFQHFVDNKWIIDHE